MADNNTLRKDLGPVTAYAIAVEAGFEGTQEEWVRRISASVDQQSFDTLAASVESGDAALSNKIDTDIGAEATARSAAVTAEAEARSTADTAEATARETADTAQSGRIDALSETVAGNDATLRNILVHKPADSYSPDGSNGQVLMTHGDGTTEWSSFGQPTPEQAAAAVSAWLDAHPEATTTVEDDSITSAKLELHLRNRTNLVTNSLAPYFQTAVANDPGSYVSIADMLYYLPEGHTADVSWENTTKVAVQTTGEIRRLNDDVTGLKSALTSVYTISDWTDGKYVRTSDGSEFSNENYAVTGFIEATKIDAVYTYFSSASGVCYYDASFTFIANSVQVPSVVGVASTLVLNKPEGCEYIRFSTNKTVVPTAKVICWTMKTDFRDSMGVKTDRGISQNTLTKLLCEEVTGLVFSNNRYIKATDGTSAQSSISCATLDFIPIDKFTHIYTMLSTSAGIAYYSSADESSFVGFEQQTSYGLKLYQLTKPQTAKYMRVSALKPSKIGISDASYVKAYRFYPEKFSANIERVDNRLDEVEKSIGVSPDMNLFSFSNIAYNATLGWVKRAYVITTDQTYLATDDCVLKANTGFLAMVCFTNSAGTTVSNYVDYTANEIPVKKGQYIRISYRNSPSGTTAISPHIGASCGNIILTSIAEKVEELMESGTGNTDGLILGANDIATPADFFIKSTDTSGRILEVLNPYAEKKSRQLMGQLHCHSWASGETYEATHIKATAEAVYDIYKRMGYDFITITNYPYGNDITPDPKPTGGMIWLCNSYEMPVMPTTIDQTHQYTHIICLNVPGVYYGGQYTGDVNSVIDSLDSEGETLVLAHPGWYWTESAQTLYTAQQLLNLNSKIKYVEVCNTFADCRTESPYISNPAYALDVLASAGRKVFGTAVSDSHVWEDDGTTRITGGNIKVFVNRRSRSEIWDAIKAGNYYCCESFDSAIKSVDLMNNVLTIDTGDLGASTKFIGKDAEVLDTVTGEKPSYAIRGTETYVRAEITLSNSKRVWTNPIYITP